MYKLGAFDGGKIGSQCGDFAAVLGFGQPLRHSTPSYYYGYGTALIASGGPYANFADIKAATFQYAAGWYAATGSCPTLKIMMGTSNYNIGAGNPDFNVGDFGNLFGDMVNDTVDLVNAHGWQSQVYVWAGIDAEPDYDHGYTNTKTIVDNFGTHDPHFARMYNFGSAEAGFWTDAQIGYISYGAAHDYGLPEIYLHSQSDNWVRVKRATSYPYDGVITDCPFGGHFPPQTAWNDLWNDMNASGVPQLLYGLQYATDLGYDPSCGNF